MSNVRTDEDIHAEGLMTQTEARRDARARNERGDHPDGMCNIAVAVPINSWGGHERGWTTILVSIGKVRR